MLINAIFEGGGIKGLAYVGVMRFLEKRGFRFNKVGGTSIGAVFASLIAVGYNSFELEEIINDFNLNIITAAHDNKASKIVKGFKYKGYYSLANFEKYLSALHKAKNKIVFGDVKQGDEYLLKMVSSDWKKKKQVILPNELIAYGYDPDRFSIAKAVAMSCSIPLVFRPYRLGEHAFLDGGVVNNFPLTLFGDDEQPTLAFSLNDPLRTKGILRYCQKKIFPNTCEYDFSKYNIIRIDTLGIKSIDFREGLAKKMDLYLSGYTSMRRYFYEHFKC